MKKIRLDLPWGGSCEIEKRKEDAPERVLNWLLVISPILIVVLILALAMN